eukprot:365303-Chlamydomonas_euryale.AAC.1
MGAPPAHPLPCAAAVPQRCCSRRPRSAAPALSPSSAFPPTAPARCMCRRAPGAIPRRRSAQRPAPAPQPRPRRTPSSGLPPAPGRAACHALAAPAAAA